nr:tetratricopeptide repeat protein [Rhodoplanes roseus]
MTRHRRAATIVAAGLVAMVGFGPAVPARAGGTEAFALYARGDYAAAVPRLVRLAQAGNARAQGLLGFLYEYGRGVPQDFVFAAMWYTCAAEQGDATAQYLLGLLYDKGRGVRVDVVLSQKWLILAAAGAAPRDREAYIRIRDAVATKMSIAQIALAQALASQWVPAPRLPVR